MLAIPGVHTVTTVNVQERTSLSGALSDFWYNGAGPTGTDIGRVLGYFDSFADEIGLSKRRRVAHALDNCSSEELPALASSLLQLLADQGHLRVTDQNAEKLRLLRKRLRPLDIRFDDDGPGASASPEPSEATDSVPAVRDHIRRISRADMEGDASLMTGSAKELLETVAKFVLTELQQPIPTKFPGLLHEAMSAVGLHAKAIADDRPGAEGTRQVLGGLYQVALGVNSLRAAGGTGHGRASTVKIGHRQARLAVDSAVVLANTILDTFDDPIAPWRESGRSPG